MADILSNTCDGTSGTAVSTANSTGPNQWNAAAATGTGTTLTWDNAHAHSGVTSMKTALATVSSTSTIDWTAAISPTPVANAFMRFYCYITAFPSVNAVVGKWIGAAASQGTIKITTTGTIQLNNGAGTQLAITTATVPLNAWCRIEFDCTSNTGTTATLAARLFSGANLETTTPDTGGNLSSAGAAVTAQTATARFGVSSAVTQTVAWNLWQDDCAFSDTATPGPSVLIPVLTAPPVPAAPPRPAAPQVITAPVTSTVTTAAASLAGAGAVTALATQAVTAALTGAGSLTAVSGTTAAAPAQPLITVTQPRAPAAPPPRPQILPAVQQDFLVVLGDMQPAQHTTAPPTVVAAQIAGLSPQPGFVLIAGDCTNDGDNTGFTGEFTNFDSMYGGIKPILRPVPGNHDWGNVVGAGNLTAYDTYWGAQAHSGATPPHFYSFDTPTGWHVVALDSDEQWTGSLGNPSATYTALAADLAANRGKPLIAYWHHPRFSDGTNTTDPGGTGDTTTVADIWNLLRDYACDLVFTGHCHSYQRFPKLGKTGTADSAGIREFVVGTGGSGLFTLTAAPGAGARSDVNSWQSAAYDQLNSQWFGFLKLYLTPSTYSWQFVSQNAVGSQNPGAVLDSGGPVPTNLSLGAVQPGGLGSAAPAGAGAVTATVVQQATAALAGAGGVAASVTQGVTAPLAGAGSVTDVVTQAVTASVAGAGSVTAKAAQAAGAAPAAAGALAALVTEAVTAAAVGAGAVSATSGGFIPGAASLAGAGSLTAAGTVFASGTAALAGTGSVAAKATQAGTAALPAAGTVVTAAVQLAPAALTGAGTLTAAGASLAATVKATSAATVTARRTSATTVTDPRDGTHSVTARATSTPAVT